MECGCDLIHTFDVAQHVGTEVSVKGLWKGFRSWPVSWQIGTAVGGIWFAALLCQKAIERWEEREYWWRFIASILN